MGSTTVTITGRHRFAKSLRAIKTVRKHARWALAPAKRAIDRARAGERVAIPVAVGERDALMHALADLGWSTASGAVAVAAKAPEPPDWWRRVKGYARVVQHLGSDDARVFRMRLALRDCTIAPGDTVGWVMHEGFVLDLPVHAEGATDDEVEVVAACDAEADVETSRAFFPIGCDLEVFASALPSRPDRWRPIREALWSALSCLPTVLVDNPEGGSLRRYRECMDRDELAHAFDELVGLAEVNAGGADAADALAEARRLLSWSTGEPASRSLTDTAEHEA